MKAALAPRALGRRAGAAPALRGRVRLRGALLRGYDRLAALLHARAAAPTDSTRASAAPCSRPARPSARGILWRRCACCASPPRAAGSRSARARLLHWGCWWPRYHSTAAVRHGSGARGTRSRRPGAPSRGSGPRTAAYFELVTTLRESFEIATQTYVVYQLSRFVGDAGVNVLASLALVANCWSTPILRVWFARSQRGPLVRTVIGTLIATVFTVFVPLAVFIKHYALARAPVATRYDPQNFIDRGNLFQQIFTLTWKDWLSTRFAAVLAIASLETIKRKAQERRKRTSPQHHHDARMAAAPLADPSSAAVHRSFSTAASWHQPSLGAARLLSRISFSERSHRISSALFAATGLTALVLHIAASSHAAPLHDPPAGLNCSLVLRPWLYGRSQCAALSLNCHRLQIQGAQVEWDAVMPTAADFLPNLMAVCFSHCQRLEMPAQPQQMHGLIQLVVVNSTLSSWGTQAALTVTANPLLSSVALMRVRNLRELPQGLLSPEFPAFIFEMSGTDLEDLPANLAQLWPQPMEVITLENGRLTHLPPVLLELQTGRISLAGNNIREIPTALFSEHEYYRAVAFTNNPVTELPAHGVTNFRARILGLIGTNVSELPEWIAGAAARSGAAMPFLHADNSPLCRPATATIRKWVTCQTGSEQLIWYAMPLDDVVARNPP